MSFDSPPPPFNDKPKKYGWFLILLSWGIFFHRALLFKGVYFYYDHLMHNYPNRLFLFENLKKGFLPMWSPTMFGGFPLLAEGQHSFFYPISFVLFYFLPFPYAYNLNIVGHFLLAGSFTYLFIKLWSDNNELGAAAAGIIYMLSGYFVVHHMHLNIVQAVAYFPILLWLSELFIRRRRYLYLVLTAVGIGFLSLGGHPQMVIFVLFFSGIYFLYRLHAVEKDKRRRTLFFYLGFAAMGLILAAVQLIPLMELVNFGSRNVQHDYRFLTYGSLPWKNLVTFILPNYFGTPQNNTYIGAKSFDYYLELCVYAGIIPILGLFFLKKDVKQHQAVRFFTILFFISLLLMLGNNTPFYRLFAYLPPFNLTRIPARIGFVSTFCLAAIVGLKWPFTKNRVIDWLIFLLLVADLFYFGYNFNPLISPNVYQPEGPITNFLKQDKSLWRVQRYFAGQLWDPQENALRADPFTPGWRSHPNKYLLASESLTPDTFTLSGFQTLDGFNQLQFLRFKEIMGAAEYKNSLIDYRPTFALLSLLNVKYVISALDINYSGLELVKSWAGLNVYRNRFVLPRAFLVSNFQVVSDPKTLPDIMRSDDFNPLEKIYLEVTPSPLSQTKLDLPAQVKILDYQNNQVTIAVQTPHDAFLLLSDAYYPGWKAYLDAKPVEIYRADYILRGVMIPAGKHQVEFVFAPRSLALGAMISAAAVSLLLTVGVFKRNHTI